jgi:hypothetical protein
MDATDAPLAYLEAGISDLAKPGGITWNPHEPGSQMEQVNKDYSEGGAHQVAQNDVYFRPGSLKRVLADPSATEGEKAASQALLKNPWGAAAGDFAAEFANPSNALLGPLVKYGGEALNASARAVPGVARALDAAADYGHELFNKYAPGRKVNDNVESILRAQDANAKQVAAHNEALVHAVYNPHESVGGLKGGTTAEEQWEIKRRATGESPMPIEQLRQNYPHTPGFTPLGKPYTPTLTDDEITKAAQQSRVDHLAADRAQLDLGANPDTMMQNYFRMNPGEDYTLHSEEELPNSFQRANGRVTNLRFRGPNGASKTFRTPTQVLEANEWYAEHGKTLLNPDFRIPKNDLAHFNRVASNVALESLRKALITEPEAAQELLQPLEEGLIAPGQVTKGVVNPHTRDVPAAHGIAAFTLRQSKEDARATAVRRAIDDVARQFGLSDEDKAWLIKTRFASPQRLKGQIAELEHGARQQTKLGNRAAGVAQGTADKLKAQAAGALEKQADAELEKRGVPPTALDRDAAVALGARQPRLHTQVGPRELAAARAAERQARSAANIAARTPNGIVRAMNATERQTTKRGAQLWANLTDPRRGVRDAYVKARNEYTKELTAKYIKQAFIAGGEVVPKGFSLMSDIPGLSGLESAHYTAVRDELIPYFTQAGAPPQEANAVATWLDRFNWLYRMGVITNPIVHPFKNLFWNYLGAGGNPARLTRMFRGAAAPLDEEARSYGAHAMFPERSALGGDVQALLNGTLGQAPGGLGGKIDYILTRVANANKKLVFDRLERNMATELWDHLSQQNIAKGAEESTAKRDAAEQVRKAFGDYSNLTAFEQKFSRALYFYPWLKTVVPFWFSASVKRPQLVTAPLRAMQTHNAVAGDPNVDTESLGTIYNGTDVNGQASYTSSGLPQTRIEPVLDFLAPRVSGQTDIGAGIPERLNAAGQVAQEHLTPLLADAVSFGRELANNEAEEPGVSPRNDVLFDRHAPLDTQAQQIAQYLGANSIPFGSQVGNLAHALSLAITKGNPSLIAPVLLGGFQYDRRTPAEQKVLDRFLDTFNREYFRAHHDHQLEANAYARFRLKVDRYLKANTAPQTPSSTP